MTCIVGLVEDKTVWIGGDSAGSDTWTISTRANPKVWKSGEFIYGYTTSFRMGDILRYKFTPPDQGNLGVVKYMATRFVDELMQCFEDNKFLHNGEARAVGGTFLVGYKARLFAIQDDFQVAELKNKYDAVGSGYHAALGSLYSTPGQEPKARVLTALKASAEYTPTVRGPFKIVSVGGEE